ncbi:uncharacterized protein LOC110893223 [Helianthus annuus]|uniref:uncharacterized protein LOC110893223 n=1 Tax=Helianthus annuus TaxID=4232 RepID=UPI000B8FE045|nr:uncharacterized protein LOC110893223 [Helianthus annuus]
MEGSNHGHKPLEESVTPGTEDKSPPVRGIGLRVTNIEGNNLFPRRGMYSTNNNSVIDGLFEISKPVEIKTGAACEGSFMAATKVSHANPSVMADKGLMSNANPSGTADKGSMDAGISTKPLSYAESVVAESLRKVNFRKLTTIDKHDGCDVLLPRDSIRVAKDKMANTLYGYFLGDIVAYPVVEYFVRNNWKRFGLQKSMMNANGFFFFKFGDQTGMMNALNEGPWIIRSQLLFLEVWSPSVKLEKKEVKKVQVWVKIHEVPIVAYTEDGLSLIALAIGEPKALDSFTTAMCVDMWGRSSYARALIEISADNDFKEELVIAVPCMDGDGFAKEKVYVEYEWIPHRCSRCCAFGHNDDACPRQVARLTTGGNKGSKQKEANQGLGPKKARFTDSDGFTDVDSRKVAKRTGFPVNKQKQKFEYRPVAPKPESTKTGGGVKIQPKSASNVALHNKFDALMNDEGESSKTRMEGDMGQEESDDEVVEVYNETNEFIRDVNLGTNLKKGASTPGSVVLNGTRIILGWDPAVVEVMVLFQATQVMHLQVVFKLDRRMIFCSVVYAANYYISRRELWNQLRMHKALVNNAPWVIMGDFNSALNLEDKSFGISNVSPGMRDFKECVEDIEMFDVKRVGMHFTWNQKPKNGVGLLKKIDRVLGNTPFVSAYPESVAVFQPYGVSDHSPCILKFPKVAKPKPRPFKFANFLVFKPNFLDIVKKEWETTVTGVYQFQVMKKLRLLKSPLRSLLFAQGNLHKKVVDLRGKLENVQKAIDQDPINEELTIEETRVLCDFQEACLDEERFLKQKSKVEWLRAGDSNSAYFHMSLKSKNHRSRIDVISDANGTTYEGAEVPDALVNHYANFLGCQGQTSLDPSPKLFTRKLDTVVANNMVRRVTIDEIKSAMYAIGNDKAQGPDGFTAAFFKHAWNIVGNDISNAVLDFFNTGKLLKQLNHTLLALIPKVTTPTRVTDYRPISCCNVLYKCISKVLVDRIKDALSGIVSINQSAFVPGRRISDNILLTQELMHNYHRHFGPPRCAFKVDIQKAYDTVDWGFLKQVLLGFGFHRVMVDWILVCVSTTSYSHMVRIDSSFRFHNKCEKQKIVNGEFSLLFRFCQLCMSTGLRSSVFILPARIIHDLEAKMRNFLWSQGSFQRGKAKVSWKSVCVPKNEGGLGIRRIGDVNKALMVSHVWSILTNRESLWVAWIHSYRLKGRNFWECKSVPNCCWSWRKLLQLRPLIRSFCWSKLGNGRDTSVWYDNWSGISPLSSFLSSRTITREGFSLQATVADLSSNGSWLWPAAWRDTYPVLIQLDQVQRDANNQDCLLWKDGDEVWEFIRAKAGMDNVEAKWSAITEWLRQRARSKSADNLVCRLLVAASAYVIWRERNTRFFKNHARPPENFCDSICDTVRYRLMGLKFKNTPKMRRLLQRWDTHGALAVDDGG